MRKSRPAEAQVIGMIKEQGADMPTAEVCRRHGLSPGTFYKLKSRYSGMELSDARRLTALEFAAAIGDPARFCQSRKAVFSSRTLLSEHVKRFRLWRGLIKKCAAVGFGNCVIPAGKFQCYLAIINFRREILHHRQSNFIFLTQF